jgi:cytochrome c-type biogenesis protein CcmE
MRGLYLRWAGIVGVALMIGGLAAQYYDREVKTITPESVLEARPAGTVRVLGMVQAGSLTMTPAEAAGAMTQAAFELAADDAHLPVRYDGPADDNLRELKTLVVVGRLEPDGRFAAHQLDLLPNYGFITAAYLLALVPLGLFLFGMERRVALLYTAIKDTTVYQPESDVDEHR